MLNVCVVLSKQCLIMLKCYVILLNVQFVLSTQCPIMLKGYVIMLKNPVILFMKHVNLSVNVLLCKTRGLLCPHTVLFY